MSENTGDSNPNEYKNAKAQAAAAKAYAKASRPWFKKKRWWLAGAIVSLMIMQAAGGGGGSATVTKASAAETTASKPTAAEPTASKPTASAEPKDKPSEKAEPSAQPAPEAVKVTASQIVHEFENNELAADSKYKGKDLQITGNVTKIDTELFQDNKYVLSLAKSKWDFLTVDCHDMSNDELATLKVGQTVTVLGTFDDGGDLGVEVNDCKLA